MTLDEYNAFCERLPATSHVIQWRGAHVWKVGSKVFTLARDEAELAVTFKVSRPTYEILQQMPGLRPAPYLASRGMSWIQHHAPPGLDDEALREHIVASHRLVAAGLSQKSRRQLGLLDNGQPAMPIFTSTRGRGTPTGNPRTTRPRARKCSTRS